MLFVFDMDNVLYGFDGRRRIASITAATGWDMAELRRRWWTYDRPGDTGEPGSEAGHYATGEDYLAAFRETLGVDMSENEWLRIRVDAMTPWPESLAAAARAAELGQVSLLTNNGPLAQKHLPTLAPELVPIFGLEHLRTSSFYGARKPDAAVYRALLASYDVPPEDVFFADDLAANVAGAESVGITAHLFTSAEGMLAAIEEFAAARIPG